MNEDPLNPIKLPYFIQQEAEAFTRQQRRRDLIFVAVCTLLSFALGGAIGGAVAAVLIGLGFV